MPTKIYGSLCVKCKGFRRLCGLTRCPILEIARGHFNVYKYFNKDNIDGSTPPSLLVGEYGYPKVRVMLNIPPNVYGDAARIYDDPLYWWGRYSLDDIIKFRSSLLGSMLKINVHNPWKLYEKEINISCVSLEPVDSEVKLYKKPKPALRFNGYTKPIALSAPVERIRITSNPLIGTLLEKRIHDDVKAAEVVIELYENGYDVYTLIHAMSGGLLGRIRDRRVVPTRWAITAVDSILGEYFRKNIIKYPYINSIEVYKGEYLSNRFIVLLCPGPLRFEWIEGWHPKSLWGYRSNRISLAVLDEDVRGRYDYMDGGYMAARMSVLEHLYNRKRQATVFIYREILPTYYAPVGNWHIRETVKRILKSKPKFYDSVDEALVEGLKFFNTPPAIWLRTSKLLREMKEQRRLTDYI
jgi:hypothetical protein